MARVTIVEDDDNVRRALAQALAAAGHEIEPAESGLDALARIVDTDPDVVVLDLGLPDIDGLELLRMLRAVSDVPVIVATARDDDQGIVRTLNTGADDYLVKPFSTEQLDARIGAVLRRARGGESRPICVGGLVIDASERTATIDGRPLKLARKEFDVLHYLAERKGKVVSKRELLNAVWHQPYGGGDKTVDVHISWLRRKLGESADRPGYLRTVRGVGVRLVDPSEQPTAETG